MTRSPLVSARQPELPLGDIHYIVNFRRGLPLEELSGRADVVIAVPPFDPAHRGLPLFFGAQQRDAETFVSWVTGWLVECAQALNDGGLLYVYGLTQWLPHFLLPPTGRLTFKYWIAIRTEVERWQGLKPEHTALALYAKETRGFTLNKVRVPHLRCEACGKTLKDHGGKTHLMHFEGCALSDVWRDLSVASHEPRLPAQVLNRILKLSRTDQRADCWVVAPSWPEGVPPLNTAETAVVPETNRCPPELLDRVHHAEAVKFMRRLPDNCIDLVFADPPYNLDKDYSGYSDGQIDDAYLRWCETWLAECVRILAPAGSLFVLNLPRWSVHHAQFLGRRLHFQRWIAWDALSEPRGKLMPAHYGLLYFTKGARPATFNYRWPQGASAERNGHVASPDAPIFCLRGSCLRKRKAAGNDPKVPLSDIWSDIHRIRHKRDRDAHPCQLPDKLLERIIRLASKEGDIVLDCFGGAGTTALVARRLGRRFVLVELDGNYVEITNRKLEQLAEFGALQRAPSRKLARSVTKKALQLELQALAKHLGRLPTKADVEQHSRYPLSQFEAVFPHWSKALKAAKAVSTGPNARATQAQKAE